MSTGKIVRQGMAPGISNKFNHALTLMNNLSEMRDERCICDFTIKVGVVTFEAHRTVLAACSAFFKAMINSDMKESAEGRTDLKGVEVGVFKHFLDYIYTGEAAVTDENCCGVLKAADMLQCDDLRDQCIQYLDENLVVGNCLRVKAIAEELSLTTLAKHAEEFSVDNFEKIVATKGFQALDFHDFIDFLRKSGEECEIVWKAIMYWIRAEEERHKFLPEALDIIDLNECTFHFLYENVWAETLVREFETCNVEIAKAVFYKMEIEDVDQRNCFELLRLAQHEDPLLINLNLIEGIEMIQCFMAREIKDVGQNPLFNELEKSDVAGICEHIAFRSSDSWSPFVNWVNINKKRRKRHFISLLENFDGGSISFEFAFNTMLTEPLVKNSVKFTSVVTVITLRVMDQKDVNTSNWFKLLHIANSNKIPESERALKLIFDFLAAHFWEIVEQENFLKIQNNDLVSVLRLQDILWNNSQNSAVVWSAVCSWINYDKKSRITDLADILKAFHLVELPFSHLFGTIFSDPLIQDSPQYDEMVVSAVLSALQYPDISFENCFQLLGLARQHDDIDTHRVVNEIHRYLSSHFEDICELEGFVNLKHTDVVRVLKTVDANCSEEMKWKAVIKWVKSDAENRSKSLYLFLRRIRLEQLSHDFLRKNIFAEDLVKQSEECKTMIIEALFQKADKPENSNPQTRMVSQSMGYSPRNIGYYQPHYISPNSYSPYGTGAPYPHGTLPQYQRYPAVPRLQGPGIYRAYVPRVHTPVTYSASVFPQTMRSPDQKRMVKSEKEEQASKSQSMSKD